MCDRASTKITTTKKVYEAVEAEQSKGGITLRACFETRAGKGTVWTVLAEISRGAQTMPLPARVSKHARGSNVFEHIG